MVEHYPKGIVVGLRGSGNKTMSELQESLSEPILLCFLYSNLTSTSATRSTENQYAVRALNSEDELVMRLCQALTCCHPTDSRLGSCITMICGS